MQAQETVIIMDKEILKTDKEGIITTITTTITTIITTTITTITTTEIITTIEAKEETITVRTMMALDKIREITKIDELNCCEINL